MFSPLVSCNSLVTLFQTLVASSPRGRAVGGWSAAHGPEKRKVVKLGVDHALKRRSPGPAS